MLWARERRSRMEGGRREVKHGREKLGRRQPAGHLCSVQEEREGAGWREGEGERGSTEGRRGGGGGQQGISVSLLFPRERSGREGGRRREGEAAAGGASLLCARGERRGGMERGGVQCFNAHFLDVVLLWIYHT